MLQRRCSQIVRPAGGNWGLLCACVEIVDYVRRLGTCTLLRDIIYLALSCICMRVCEIVSQTPIKVELIIPRIDYHICPKWQDPSAGGGGGGGHSHLYVQWPPVSWSGADPGFFPRVVRWHNVPQRCLRSLEGSYGGGFVTSPRKILNMNCS